MNRSLVFNDDEIEVLADMKYSNPLTFALLSLIFPEVDLTNHYHVDHIFPTSRFTPRQLREASVQEDRIDNFIERKDGLANLQLLKGKQNLGKSAKLPSEWLTESFSNIRSRERYQNDHLLGEVPESIVDFESFYEKRRERLKIEIRKLLGKLPENV